MSYKIQSGIQFEDSIIDIIGSVSVREWGVGAFRASTVIEDSHKGTDCFVLGLPIDITLNFKSKNRMRVFNAEMDLGFFKVKFGLRIGNSKETFDTPVLVIGFDSDLNLNACSLFNDLFEDKLKEILETGMDAYFAYEV